jgi:large subunit ribosomal protein L29
MKAEDLKTKTVDELQKLLLDARKEQLNLRFQKSGGQLSKTADVRKNRRNIARLKTFLNTKQQPQTDKPQAKASAKKPAAKKAKSAAKAA